MINQDIRGYPPSPNKMGLIAISWTVSTGILNIHPCSAFQYRVECRKRHKSHTWEACCKIKKNQVGSNSSISIDRMLSPVEIVHLTIISRVYYIYLDTINGTNNFTDFTITKFSESNYGLCCFTLSFRKYYQVRSHLCHTLAFKFTYNFNSH